MIPFEDFLRIHGIGTFVVAALAFLIRWANARKSTKDWFIGWWVFALIVGGWAAGGTVHYMHSQHIYFTGSAAWGGLFGLISGNVIGHWVWKHYHKEIEPEDDLE